MKDLKYLAALSLPLSAIIGFYFKEHWSFFTPIYAFIIIPVLELLLPQDTSNLEGKEREEKKKSMLFDWMLYLNLPLVFGLLAFLLWDVSNHSYQMYELVGLVLSMGIVLGTNGINVAHELGHRHTGYERFMAKALLLPSAYMHFYIEHNRGHHKNVSTLEDPASSRLNETLYHFWARSVIYGFISAWNLEKKRLGRANQSVWSLKNEMLRFQLLQLGFWIAIALFFGVKAMLIYTAAAIIGFLMLETVNYIEHYGLARKKVSENRYQRVEPIHSWNSNHVVGRLMLFELSRHSDHHYKPAKKYQTLEHHDRSPQMPTGYPGMMLLSAIPPVWFYVMNPRISGVQKHSLQPSGQ